MLAVAVAAVGGLDAESGKRDGVRHRPVDLDGLAAHGLQFQIELAGGVDVSRARVKQLDDGIALGGLVGGVLHGGGQLCLVALAQEARHVGAHHQRLLGEHLGHP